MEDVYDDLDNYHDVNAVQELRIENMELKVKLEEHATAMEKLQKEYDTLEIEFKKLENNYSSLLKTARAEIERKTKRISQLNIEKDMMVLNSLKSGKRTPRYFSKVQNVSKINNDEPGREKGSKKFKEDESKVKKVEAKNEKFETSNLQPKDKILSSGTVKKSNIDSRFEKADSSNYRTSNVNENLSYQNTEFNDPSKTQASRITNRRKSMPSVSMPTHNKFSSDEEFEQNHPTKDTKTDIPSSNKFDRRYKNKIPFDKNCNRTSETSSVDDRGSNYHEKVRETYRGRQTSRNSNNSFYRGKDKYEVSLKYRKHYSPEREQRRHLREHQPDYHRHEKGRYRTLESPPPESHSHYQRRNQESRSNYDRHTQENEKYRHRYEENHAVKHRMANDYDEPHSKRQKMESFGHSHKQYNEERRYHNDTEAKDVQPVPEFSPNDDDIRMSCQSPDYENVDAAFANPTKEIMATATTPLEDPRLTSKRYIINKESGKEILSTAVGRNINIIPLNKAEWNVPPGTVPQVPYALVRRPSQCSDDFIKDIYMDIDNPVANLSIESGEIFESENDYLESRNKKAISKTALDHDMNKQTMAVMPMKSANADNISKSISYPYRIPKLGQRYKHTQSKMDVPIIDVVESIPNKNNLPEEDICSKISTTKPQHYNEHPSNNVSGDKIAQKHGNQVMLSKMTIVADDLELSDENSDTVDSQRPCKVLSSIKEAEKYTIELKRDSHNILPDIYDSIDSHRVIHKEISQRTCEDFHKEGRKEDYVSNLESDLPNVKFRDDSQRQMLAEKVHKACKVHLSIKETRSDESTSSVHLNSNQQMEVEKCQEPCEVKSNIKENIQENYTCHVESDISNIISPNNVKIPTQIVTEKLKKTCNVQSNLSDFEEDTLSAARNDSCHRVSFDGKTEKTVDTALIKSVVTYDKTKEIDSIKKHKTKKKKTKSKEASSKDLVETLDTIQVIEKKTKSKRDKEDKPKELNNKFSDLFGDSSSLMTPEDLGLPSYLPISEDAQDAVDIKINQIIDDPPPIDIPKIAHYIEAQNNSNINKKEETAIVNNTKNALRKSSSEDFEVTKDIDKNKSLRPVEESIESMSPIEVAPRQVYENLNSETVFNEPDVVKTVIISTGMQPQFTLKKNENEKGTVVEKHDMELEANTKQNVTACKLIPATIEFKRDIMKALATSTPQKEFIAPKSLEVDSRTTDFICDSNISKPIGSTDNESQVVDHSNGLDAPDVRIFVKRRRKVVKRPPMT